MGRALEEARNLGLRGGWESELRKDRPLPISNPVHRVYLDNFDMLERVNSSMAKVVRGSVAPLADPQAPQESCGAPTSSRGARSTG